MFEKIIIASELPKDMEVFIRSLGDLKKIGTKECIVLQCIEPDDMLSQLIQMLKEAYQGNLDREIEILKEMGFEASGQLIEGELKYVINRLATEEDCDLIVVGSRKTNKFGDPIWGGAAHEVIHRPSKPILQIRIHNKVAEDETVLEKEDLFRHVLFPTDFSENADMAYDILLKMASFDIKKITLAHVFESEDQIPEAEKNLISLKTRLEDAGANDVTYRLLEGSPTKALINLMNTDEVSLVIMGSQGRGRVQEIFLGSLSHNIARHSDVSVLLIPSWELN